MGACAVQVRRLVVFPYVLVRLRCELCKRKGVEYLVLPRVLAATLMFPVIVALAILVGILTGWLTSLYLLHLSTPDFIKGLKLFYLFKDTWFGLFKSATFGATTALVGCRVGLATYGGAEGVGRSTTRAVVLSAVLILMLDAFWAVVLL